MKRISDQSSYQIVAKRARKGVKSHRFSLYGGYTMAFKRNVAHTSCSGLSEILDLDVTRQAVVLWELQAASNLLLQSRCWYFSMYERVADANRRGKLTWEITAVRGDATNSSTLQSLKVHAVEATTTFHIPPTDDDEFDDMGGTPSVFKICWTGCIIVSRVSRWCYGFDGFTWSVSHVSSTRSCRVVSTTGLRGEQSTCPVFVLHVFLACIRSCIITFRNVSVCCASSDSEWYHIGLTYRSCSQHHLFCIFHSLSHS
jgi:hypothetical protein